MVPDLQVPPFLKIGRFGLIESLYRNRMILVNIIGINSI